MTSISLKDLAQKAKIEPEKDPTESPDYYFPDLPAEARLSDKLLVQGEKAGLWLKAYADFAGKASPMTAPEHHQILGLTLAATAIGRRDALKAGTNVLNTATDSEMPAARATVLHCTSKLWINPSVNALKSSAAYR